MATRNNGKSIKMFYLSTNLPGKYQWLAPSLSCNTERPSWICYVNSIKHLILISSLTSFSYLNSAYHVTLLLHHLTVPWTTLSWNAEESPCALLFLSFLTIKAVEHKTTFMVNRRNSFLWKHLYQKSWTEGGGCFGIE